MNFRKMQLYALAAMPLFFIAVSAPAQVAVNFDYDGAQLKSKNSGVEEYVKPDGSRIFKYPDREKAILKDGTVIERRSGKREISAPDGTRLHIDSDGSRRYIYSDGRERVFTMEGKTPYGEDIRGVEKKINNNGVSLILEYSAQLSDDQVDGAVRLFFDELISACETELSGKNPGNGTPVRIVISNCRFCRTGYCSRKKNGEIEAIIYRGTDIHKKLNVPYNGILKKENRQTFISRIIQALAAR